MWLQIELNDKKVTSGHPWLVILMDCEENEEVMTICICEILIKVSTLIRSNEELASDKCTI